LLLLLLLLLLLQLVLANAIYQPDGRRCLQLCACVNLS